MNIEYALQSFEAACDDMDDVSGNITITTMKAMRRGLTRAGMDRSYADQLVASSNISITSEMSPEDIVRLTSVAERIAYKFYNTLRDAEFNDQAISLMGHQFTICIDL